MGATRRVLTRFSSLYPIRLEDRLPPIAIPLLPGDPSVTLDLQSVCDRCYDAGPYARGPLWYGHRDPAAPTRPGRLGRADLARRPGLMLRAMSGRLDFDSR
jgi:hypothetical protein